MRIVANNKLIKRNSRIAKYTNYAGLGLFAFLVFMYYSMYSAGITEVKVYVLTGTMIAAFILMQFSSYYMDRYGRSPRPDEILDRGLKGLGREYTIYHYVLPAAHVLIGPAGIWTLLTYSQTGKITYERKRWRQRGGGFIQGYLKIFGQGTIGRPDLEADSAIQLTRRKLESLVEGHEVPVQAALLFLHPKVTIEAEDSPLPAFTPKDLKDFLKQKAKGTSLSPGLLEEIRRVLPQPEKEE